MGMSVSGGTQNAIDIVNIAPTSRTVSVMGADFSANVDGIQLSNANASTAVVLTLTAKQVLALGHNANTNLANLDAVIATTMDKALLVLRNEANKTVEFAGFRDTDRDIVRTINGNEVSLSLYENDAGGTPGTAYALVQDVSGAMDTIIPTLTVGIVTGDTYSGEADAAVSGNAASLDLVNVDSGAGPNDDVTLEGADLTNVDGIHLGNDADDDVILSISVEEVVALSHTAHADLADLHTEIDASADKALLILRDNVRQEVHLLDGFVRLETGTPVTRHIDGDKVVLDVYTNESYTDDTSMTVPAGRAYVLVQRIGGTSASIIDAILPSPTNVGSYGLGSFVAATTSVNPATDVLESWFVTDGDYILSGIDSGVEILKLSGSVSLTIDARSIVALGSPANAKVSALHSDISNTDKALILLQNSAGSRVSLIGFRNTNSIVRVLIGSEVVSLNIYENAAYTDDGGMTVDAGTAYVLVQTNAMEVETIADLTVVADSTNAYAGGTSFAPTGGTTPSADAIDLVKITNAAVTVSNPSATNLNNVNGFDYRGNQSRVMELTFPIAQLEHSDWDTPSALRDLRPEFAGRNVVLILRDTLAQELKVQGATDPRDTGQDVKARLGNALITLSIYAENADIGSADNGGYILLQDVELKSLAITFLDVTYTASNDVTGEMGDRIDIVKVTSAQTVAAADIENVDGFNLSPATGIIAVNIPSAVAENTTSPAHTIPMGLQGLHPEIASTERVMLVLRDSTNESVSGVVATTEKVRVRLGKSLVSTFIIYAENSQIDHSTNTGFVLVLDISMDTDGDGTPDIDDVDDDNDGLMEIHYVDVLDHVRHNLEGTSYKSSAAATAITIGAPTSMTTNCSTPSGGVYLCGYELSRDLDFTEATSYKSYAVTSAWFYSSTNAGFPGLGATTGTTGGFNAIFEGNGHSINNFYMRNTGSTGQNLGLFRLTGSNAQIRNLGFSFRGGYGIYGGSGADFMGLLVGRNYGSIMACHFTYTTGELNIHGRVGNDTLGGLVGYNASGATIVMSYMLGRYSLQGGRG